jgi:multidrug resistance efflux pump
VNERSDESLAADPATVDRAAFRARVDAGLARIEARVEEALDKADAASVSIEERGNMYRLLGAYRGLSEALVEGTQAKLTAAELDLEFKQVTAPVEGYVANLNPRLGSQAVANQPALALIDINSFWVHGYFRESYIGGIGAGDRAVVTLMSYPDHPLEGRVDSLGWGIYQDDGSTGANLLPDINQTFQWIRLTQRVPVRVHLSDVPDDVQLRVGTTAVVLVMKGSATAKGGVSRRHRAHCSDSLLRSSHNFSGIHSGRRFRLENKQYVTAWGQAYILQMRTDVLAIQT